VPNSVWRTTTLEFGAHTVDTRLIIFDVFHFDAAWFPPEAITPAGLAGVRLFYFPAVKTNKTTPKWSMMVTGY